MLKNAIIKAYCRQVHTRNEDTGNVFYFSPQQFKGLHCKAHSFASSLGHTLQGYFYYYDAPAAGRIVILDHGMGSGHRGYMKEIELLARHGYLVFAYDHAGCVESGGESTSGFAQSLRDLDDAVKMLKVQYQDHTLSVIGHSWGAFSTMNIGALHPDIKHQVALSGFISVEAMLHQLFHGFTALFYKHIFAIEQRANPEYIKFDACNSLTKTNAKVLLIYSEDDPTVRAKYHFDVLEKKLHNRDNIRFLRVSGKAHSPNYTEDAVKYKDAFFKALTDRIKKKQLVTAAQKQAFVAAWDWERMTAQDEKIWSEIFKTLDN